MSVKLSKLKTIKNYAAQEGVTPQYIYKLIKNEKMDFISIDGVQFINVEAFPTIPVTDRRNRQLYFFTQLV